MSIFKNFVGPRIPANSPESVRMQYRLPTLLFSAAAVVLLVSIFLPYWQMTLHAPQYPGGLRLWSMLTK